MGVVVVCRAKAGGCCTTTAVVLAACWPDRRQVTVVEADASGGAAAARLLPAAGPGLVDWVAAGSSPRSPGQLLRQMARPVPGLGISLIPGPMDTSPAETDARSFEAGPDVLSAGAASASGQPDTVAEQGSAVWQARAAVAELSRQRRLLQVGHHEVVVVDVGHLSPASPAWPLAVFADAVAVCGPASLDGLSAAFGLARQLRTAHPYPDRLGLVVVGAGAYPRGQIAAAAPVPLLGEMAHDARAALALSTGAGLSRRSRLARSGTRIAERCARLLAASTPSAPATPSCSPPPVDRTTPPAAPARTPPPASTAPPANTDRVAAAGDAAGRPQRVVAGEQPPADPPPYLAMYDRAPGPRHDTTRGEWP